MGYPWIDRSQLTHEQFRPAIDAEMSDALSKLDTLEPKDILTYAFKEDPSLFNDLMKEGGAEVFTREGVQSFFDEHIDGEFVGDIEIRGQTFAPSTILKTLDSDTYEDGFREFMRDEKFVKLDHAFDGNLGGAYDFVQAGDLSSMLASTTSKALCDVIFDRRPDLAAEKQAHSLQATVESASASWSPADLSGDHLVPKSGQGEQAPVQRQSRRL